MNARRARNARLVAPFFASLLAPLLALCLVAGIPLESDARGGARGGGGGLSRGGLSRGGMGGGMGGGVYRGGPAGGGSIRGTSSRGSYRTGDSQRRSGSFETRRGETVDWSGTTTRTDDGIHREGSWQSSSGASGGSSSDIRVEDGRVQSRDRSSHAQNASGDKLERDVHSERHDGHVDREARTRTNTGIDAESNAQIKRTDDGIAVRGGIVGNEGAAGGTVVRKGDQTWARGAATDGKHVTWGGAHCNGNHCYGGRATVKVKDYYDYPYYYYPYYYGYYSCPYGSIQTWSNPYGTPIYGCSNVYVVHTTISLGASETKSPGVAPGDDWPAEAEVSSAPVLMYEVSPEVVAYATTYRPHGVFAEKLGQRFFWVPGPAEATAEAKQAIATAGAMPQPTANATVITYDIGERTVYLTNEPPIPGFYAETADQLSVWIPGVREPTDADRNAIRTAITAHQAGGRDALDREVRKLEANREPPPDAA